MSYTVTIEQDGSIKLPQKLLEALGLNPNEAVIIQLVENNLLAIEPQEEIAEEEGFEPEAAIFHAEEEKPLNLNDLLKEVDEEHLIEGFSEKGWLTREEFRAILRSYEEGFGMSSTEFYEKWNRGEMPDTWDTNSWAFLYRVFLEDDLVFKGEASWEELLNSE